MFFQAVAVSVLLYSCTTCTWRRNVWRRRNIGTTEGCYMLFWTNPASSTYNLEAVRSLTAYHTNYPNKMSRTCWALLVKKGWIHKRRSPMNSNTWTHQCCLSRKHIHQLCADTGYCLEEKRWPIRTDRERGGVKRICAVSMSWWWPIHLQVPDRIKFSDKAICKKFSVIFALRNQHSSTHLKSKLHMSIKIIYVLVV